MVLAGRGGRVRGFLGGRVGSGRPFAGGSQAGRGRWSGEGAVETFKTAPFDGGRTEGGREGGELEGGREGGR